MSGIRLIVTDLDGTLISNPSEFPLYADFRKKMNELRKEEGVTWAICTGRALSSFRSFFSPMRLMEIAPDFVIIRHAYIYSVGKTIYVPHVFWNLHIFYLIWNSESYIRETLSEWDDMMRCFPSGMTSVFRGKRRLWMRFDSEDAAAKVEDTLKQRAANLRFLQIFRRKLEVDVRAIPFTKGLAVSELAQHLGIDSANILTIGDGHNDISMLDPKVAGMTGCPANARAEVMQTVHDARGHIARKEGLHGLIEILDAHRSGKVNSEFPENWIPPSELPSQEARKHHPREHGKFGLGQVLLILAVLYVLLLVFANFKLVPKHAQIMKPYWMLIDAIQTVWRLIFG